MYDYLLSFLLPASQGAYSAGFFERKGPGEQFPATAQ